MHKSSLGGFKDNKDTLTGMLYLSLIAPNDVAMTNCARRAMVVAQPLTEAERQECLAQALVRAWVDRLTRASW